MKKLEEQESAINVACPMEDEASWVITCKGDHEKEITQFDGETVKKMMINEISTFLSNVDCANSADSEGNWRSDAVDSRGTHFRVHRLRNHRRSCPTTTNP